MYRFALPLVLLLLIQGCTGPPRAPEPGIGEPVSWDALARWDADRQVEAWPALLASCEKLVDEPAWTAVCRDASRLDQPSDVRVRRFLESRLRPHPVVAEDGGRKGLITGYYEPLLRGSLQRGGRYQVPLYAPPDDLLRIDLGGAYPELNDLQLRGRLEHGRVVPYPSRGELGARPDALAGHELLWVDDTVDAFFLHVQGSGRVRLADGRTVAVRFADHNGRPYHSIGRHLIDIGALDREEVTLFSIRRWLREHPAGARRVYAHNPRFIFFRLHEGPVGNPVGAMNVPLTPGRSLAVDRTRIPMGVPVWLSTSMPGDPERPLQRLMMAQDTGGAIRGWTRADVFWGLGREAERKAGLMKEQGRMYVLLPR